MSADKSIVLTDWPKLKTLVANYRGVETEKLIELQKQMFHTMMIFEIEVAGGYAIEYNCKEVAKELKFRKTVPEGY